MHFIMPRFFVNCERWKWNDDLRIYVSTHGHVKDEYKKNVAAKINGNGYFCVRVNGRFYAVHRLVLMTWRPLPNDGTPMTVDHLDSNRRNNHLENLEWVSQAENLRRATENLEKDKAANCEVCLNFKPTTSAKPGSLVLWKELCEKFGYAQTKIPYQAEGFMDKVKELWKNGQVVVYKKNSTTKITPAMVQQAIAGQPNSEGIIERFLIKSINRTGKYLGWAPWMRWSKQGE